MQSISQPKCGTNSPTVQLGCEPLESRNPAGSSLGGPKERSAPECTRIFVKHGEHLYESGDSFNSIYSILAGAFKTCAVTGSGEEHVIGFYLRGAVMGLDAMATRQHAISAIALEDSEVCCVAAESLEQHYWQDESVAKRVHLAMAKEIHAQQRVILMLGSKTAEQRVASFLVELAATYLALGDPSSDLDVVMTRTELGSYLGLTFETVSRILSHFQDRQFLAVNRRHVRILDMARLKHLMV